MVAKGTQEVKEPRTYAKAKAAESSNRRKQMQMVGRSKVKAQLSRRRHAEREEGGSREAE